MSTSMEKDHRQPIPKAPTGIAGLDEITGGGLPRGRTTLVCGSAGCGKTLMAMEFLVRGATEYDEPGVFMAFEETAAELTENVRSLGFDLGALVELKKMSLEYVRVERSEIEETGEYDLEGLFIRLGFAVDSIGAKRVVLDTIESLFAGLSNETILRAELRRLFRWLKDRGLTAIVTGERGEGQLTRHGLEEYVSDCVIVLDHRVREQVSTRRMRILKYRGSVHGTSEYPFLIDENGISVLPITSLRLEHEVSEDRVSTGVPRLDAMLDGDGYYRGSTVLISGTAGTGKTSLAAHFANAACARGEKCLYLAFEESQDQVVRNMRTIGVDLEQWIREGPLTLHAERPTAAGLEFHLVRIHKWVEQVEPRIVIVDPITNFLSVNRQIEVRAMVTRLIDFLKSRSITAFVTSLTTAGKPIEETEVGISSLMDTWIVLRDEEGVGKRNRTIYILKSRGMNHSNQVREFCITNRGVDILDAYVSPAGVLTGAAGIMQQAEDRAEVEAHEQRIEAKRRELDRRRRVLDCQIGTLQAEFEAEEERLNQLISRSQVVQEQRPPESITVERMCNTGFQEEGET